jgi:hypothetical protein
LSAGGSAGSAGSARSAGSAGSARLLPQVLELVEDAGGLAALELDAAAVLLHPDLVVVVGALQLCAERVDLRLNLCLGGHGLLPLLRVDGAGDGVSAAGAGLLDDGDADGAAALEFDGAPSDGTAAPGDLCLGHAGS